MKKIMIIAAMTTAMPMAAQTQNDSTAIEDSIFRSLPEVMVSGRRPVVKAEPGKLVFDMGALTKDRPAYSQHWRTILAYLQVRQL